MIELARKTQYITSSGELFKGGGRLWRVSDWCHLMEHIGTNAPNYFMYQWAGRNSNHIRSQILFFPLIHMTFFSYSNYTSI